MHLEHAAERLVGLAQPVDLGDHRLARLGVEAPDRRLVDVLEVLRASGRPARGASTPVIWITCEKTSTPSSRRNALATAPPATRAAVSRALARSRTFRTSVSPYFCVPDEVGVAGPRQVDLGDRRLDRPRVHPLLPVRVVAVGDLERDRAAERPAVADAAGDLDLVALDLHPAAAAVAELAAGEIAVQRVAIEPPGRPASPRGCRSDRGRGTRRRLSGAATWPM